MVNKIFSPLSLTGTLNCIRPYLTARTAAVSILACGIIFALGLYLYKRIKPGPGSQQSPALNPLQFAATTPAIPANSPGASGKEVTKKSLNSSRKAGTAATTPSQAIVINQRLNLFPVSPPISTTLPTSLPVFQLLVSAVADRTPDASPSPTPTILPATQPLVDGKSSSASAVVSPPQLPLATLRKPYLNIDPNFPNFKNNVQIILEFPEDGSAQIKSINGQLVRAEGFWRYYNACVATQLHETIPVISDTFKSAHAMFEEAVSAVEGQQTTADKISLMRALGDAFVQEMKLLKGLENIQKVYEARYQNNAEHKGMNELNTLYSNTQQKLNVHKENYERLVQSLQASQANLTASLVQRSTKEPTTEEAAESLSAYCDKYCPGVQSSKAAASIQQGQQLLKDILCGDVLLLDIDPQVAQTQLASIAWFMMYTWGIQTKRGACEAAFVIEEGSKLYEFMMSGQQRYPRASSHYIGRSSPTTGYTTYLVKSSAHYGIDLKEGLLPAQKRTILFGMVDSPHFINPKLPKQVLFFKPENWSTQGSSWQHSIEYVESVQKKCRAQGEDDALGMQKERVPDNAKTAFIKLLDHIQTNEAIYTSILATLDPNIYDLNAALDKAKLWGIAYMNAFINSIITHSNCPAEFNTAAQDLIDIIRPLPHPDRQTGRELYITADDFQVKVSDKLQFV